MFRRVHIANENRLVRESGADFRKLVKEQVSLHRIHIFTAIILGVFLLLELTIIRKFDELMTGGIMIHLICNFLGMKHSRQRLRELHAIRGI